MKPVSKGWGVAPWAEDAPHTQPWVLCPALRQLGVGALVHNPSMRETGGQKHKTTREPQPKQKPRGKSTLLTTPTTLSPHGPDEGEKAGEMACGVAGLPVWHLVAQERSGAGLQVTVIAVR